MRDRGKKRITLGELIVAVTNEVAPLVRDHNGRYAMVSSIVSDLIAHGRVRLLRRRPGQLLRFA